MRNALSQIIIVLTLMIFLIIISSLSYAQEMETVLSDSTQNINSSSDSLSILNADSSQQSDSLAFFADSLITDSLTYIPDSLLSDSLLSDSLLSDSTAIDSLNPVIEKVYALYDSLPPEKNLTTFRLHKSEMYKVGYKDLGEALAPLPGLFPRQKSLYKHSFYLLTPGGSGRDVQVLYRGRPYNDPIYNAVNYSALSAGAVEFADYDMAWNGGSFASSGPVLNLTQPIDYPEEPATEVNYRQGYYASGDVDWRIAHKLHRGFRYFIGVNYGEMEGRYPNSASVGNNVRLGGESNLGNWGTLGFYWMQGRNIANRDRSNGEQRYKRYDYDLIWRYGVSDQPNYTEVALWHVKSSHSYNRSGIRSGWRALKKFKIASHQFKMNADIENISAKLGRLPEAADPQGQRWVAGAGLNDKFDLLFLNINGGLRAEMGTVARDSIGPENSRADDGDKEWIPRFGGSIDFATTEINNFSIIGLNSLSWRWPSIDESYGRWIQITPDRYLSPKPPYEYPLLFQGDGRLKPVGGYFSGAGVKGDWAEDGELKILAGYRKYIDPIDYVEYQADYWGILQGNDRDGVEVNASMNRALWNNFDISASFTYADFNQDVPIPESWGRATLGWQHYFFEDDLFLRAYVTAKYWGEYSYNRSYGEAEYVKFREPARAMYDLMLIGRIMNFELFWGINNETSAGYDFIPGYPAMFREEIWGVRWKMFG